MGGLSRAARDRPDGARGGVTIRFFHGRGGSIARGVADPRQSIADAPPAARSWHFKQTEQGEVIASRYGLPSLARRNLESSATSLIEQREAVPAPEEEPSDEMMDRIAGRAYAAYRALVDDPRFVSFFEACTADQRNRRHADQLASRAARRDALDRGSARRAVELRVDANARDRGEMVRVRHGDARRDRGLGHRRAARSHGRTSVLSIAARKIERGLATADLTIFELYAAALAGDREIREHFVARIRSEFEMARSALLDIVQRDRLLATDDLLARAITQRNPYVDPMSYLQIRLIRDFRASHRSEATLRDAIRLTINGIASGLRVTG